MTPVVAEANTVGVIDGSRDHLSGVVTGVGRPGGIASGAGAVWITDNADDMLLQVDSADRVGNYQFHPYWNLLIDQLWVH